MTKVGRGLVGFAAFAAIVIGVTAAEFGISYYWTHRPPPFTNVPADRDALRSEFVNEPWYSDIVAARWRPDAEILYVQSSTSDERTVLAMCRALEAEAYSRFADGRGMVFVFDRDGDYLATTNGFTCYWRQ